MIFTSNFSGKADLFDYIAGLGGWFDKDGNPAKFGQEGVGVYYSDELECFEEFKRRTGGVIYQHHKVKVNEYNQKFVKEHCPQFDFIEHKDYVEDKRTIAGKREVIYYTYIYWDKEYTLKELNKHGVYITTEIHFDTLLDIIPYYPYIISMSCRDGDTETVYISNESYVDREFKQHLENGWISELDYKKELQKHYLEVCKEYFLKDLDKRTKTINLKDLYVSLCHEAPSDVIGYYVLKVEHPIDYMHDIKYIWKDGKNHPHWTSPKMIDENTIKLSRDDIESYLRESLEKGEVSIQYVEKMEFEKELK